MIDIDKLEALAKAVGAGPAAQRSADPILRNMGRLEHDDAIRSLFRELTPAAILALVAEVRALRAAAQGVLDWTEVKHRPPVPEAIPCGEMARVRVHALVELYRVVNAERDAK